MNDRPCDFAPIRQSLLLEGEPGAMPIMELHVDDELMTAILGRPATRYDPLSLLPFQQAMGYDTINVYSDLTLEFNRSAVLDGTAESLATRRSFVNEQDGPITSDAEFDAYPWPDPAAITFGHFERLLPHLPAGMAMVARCHGPFEYGSWLMGIQRFCLDLALNRPLVEKIFARVSDLIVAEVAGMVRQAGVGAVWITDDLGFNSGPFIAPADLDALVLPTYREIVRLARARDLPVLLHSCGNLGAIMGRLVECGINALHSLPPGLYDMKRLKADWGDRLCLLGNIDVDLLTRGTEEAVRRAVRTVRDEVFPGGGVILSSSNSIPNYVRPENYLAMMDEARK